MDMNLLRGIVTALSLIVFLAIVYSTFKRSNKASLEAQGMTPLLDDIDLPAARDTGSVRKASGE